MNLKVAKITLKVMSVLELIYGVLMLVAGVLFLTGSDLLKDYFDEIVAAGGNELGKGGIFAVFVFVALIIFLVAWLYRVAAKDGKKTTLLLVFLILACCYGVYSLVTNFSVTSLISLLLDAFVLSQVFVVRKNA